MLKMGPSCIVAWSVSAYYYDIFALNTIYIIPSILVLSGLMLLMALFFTVEAEIRNFTFLAYIPLRTSLTGICRLIYSAGKIRKLNKTLN